MTRARPIYTSFNAGEMSPLVGGRPDMAQYKAGLSRCENFLPRVQGAVTRRGGTSFVAEVKNTEDRTWLVPFEFAVNDAFVLEFGHNYIRFYRDRAVLEVEETPAAWNSDTDYQPGQFVMSGGVTYQARKPSTAISPTSCTDHEWYPLSALGPNGKPIYEILTSFSARELTSVKDGSFALRYVQSGDVINFAHPRHLPLKLTRYSNLDWRIEEFVTEGGPFKDQNEDKEITVQVGGLGEGVTFYEKQLGPHGDVLAAISGGKVSLTASADIFVLPDEATSFRGHEGSKFLLQMQDTSGTRPIDGGESAGVSPWYVYKPTFNGDRCTSDGKHYFCTHVADGDYEQSAVTGTEKPVHTEGAYWDGDGSDIADDERGPIGVQWKYLHAGYGWVRIDEVADARNATATVLSTLPIEVMREPTWRWAHAAWSDVEGWPDNVTYFRERLTFSKGRTIYASQAGDFANFKAKDFGEVLASSAITLTIDGGSGDAIEWLCPADKLLVGVGGTVHAVSEASLAQAFAPANTAVKDQVLPGANGVQPLMADEVLYVEKGGQILNECFMADAGKYDTGALTIFAEHLTRTGVVAMAWHKRPYAIAWCVNAAGGLLGLTYNKPQKVVGWSRMATDGDVESVAVIPAPDGRREDLWLIVRRKRMNGSQIEDHRYIEVLNHEYADGDDLELLRYSDCSLVYDGTAQDEIGGLDHLEGRTVNVLADGAAHPQCTVSGGAITLQAPAGKVVVGLPAPAYLKLMPIEAGGVLGSAQGAIKRVSKVILRLINSLGGRIGPNDAVMDLLSFRTSRDPMDKAPPLFTGDKEVDFPGDYSGRASVAIACEDDLPFTLAAMMLDVTTHEG